MMDNASKVSSIGHLHSVNPTKAQEAELELELERIQAMDLANRKNSQLQRTSTTKRKSVRFSTTIGRNRSISPPGIDIPSINAAHRQHHSTRECSPPECNDESQHHGELLMPVRYSPPSESESEHSTLSDDSWNSVGHDGDGHQLQYALPVTAIDRTSKLADLTVDTDTYRGHTRNISSYSRRARRDSHQFDIYFTPTDYTRSQIFLSSPVPSPELPLEKPEDECLTPKASMSRPPSAIYIGSEQPFLPHDVAKREKLKITPAQLDQLIKALAKSQLIQRHVRKQYWDDTGTSDDDSPYPTTSTLLTASNSTATISSPPNETFLQDEHGCQPLRHPYANRPLPPPPVPFGGISLLDSKIHGSPVRYTSNAYRQGSKVMTIGSCPFLNLPYGTDVECTLRIEPASSYTETCKVMLQATNQVVDRKTSKRAFLLIADLEVTDLFAKAALTEFAEAIGTSVDDILLLAKSTTLAAEETNSIDWCALADEMQHTADVVHLLDAAIRAFSTLKSETCAMRTLALVSELDRLKDQYQDFLIVLPTKFHGNGMPASMRMPWVSQRLWNDWYAGKDAVGYSTTAREFQERIVGHVARRARGGEKFTVGVEWKGGEEEQIVHCVPLIGRGEDLGGAWVCFMRGEFDLQS